MSDMEHTNATKLTRELVGNVCKALEGELDLENPIHFICHMDLLNVEDFPEALSVAHKKLTVQGTELEYTSIRLLSDVFGRPVHIMGSSSMPKNSVYIHKADPKPFKFYHYTKYPTLDPTTFPPKPTLPAVYE